MAPRNPNTTCRPDMEPIESVLTSVRIKRHKPALKGWPKTSGCKQHVRGPAPRRRVLGQVLKDRVVDQHVPLPPFDLGEVQVVVDHDPHEFFERRPGFPTQAFLGFGRIAQ